ncbi:Endophilin-A2, partial [Balamuthia mandrillaris]
PVSFPPRGSGGGEYNDVPYSQPFQQSFHPLQPPHQQQQQYPPQQSQQSKSLPPLPPRAAAGRPTAVVLYDWIAENEGELPEMKTGETVDIVDNSDSVWLLVTRNGVEGYIPSNYVQF